MLIVEIDVYLVHIDLNRLQRRRKLIKKCKRKSQQRSSSAMEIVVDGNEKVRVGYIQIEGPTLIKWLLI